MDNLQYLYCDGIPFGRQELHPHPYIFIYLYTTHTCAQTTHKCLRALPADELGHFSLPCLRGIKCVIMELSHNEPKLWIDKSQLQSTVQTDYTGCRTGLVEGPITLFHSPFFHYNTSKQILKQDEEMSQAAPCSAHNFIAFSFFYMLCRFLCLAHLSCILLFSPICLP